LPGKLQDEPMTALRAPATIFSAIAWPATSVALLLSALPCIALAADAAPAKPSPSGRIAGGVLDDKGKPVPGAAIRLYEYDFEAARWKQPMRGKSSPNGAYQFAGLPASWRYLLVVDFPAFAEAFRQTPVQKGQQLTIDIGMRKAVTAVIDLTDAAGRPVADARVQSLAEGSINGLFTLSPGSVFDVPFSPSDVRGRLLLPPLPDGSTADVKIVHPGFAPIEVRNIHIHPKAEIAAVMRPGVAIELRLVPGDSKDRVSSLEIDLRHETFNNPSTTFGQVYFDGDGVGRVIVAPGNYQFLWLKHRDFLVTPEYDARDGKFLTVARGSDDKLLFELHRKVLARGRVINGATGRPFIGATLKAEIPNHVPTGGKTELADTWMLADWSIAPTPTANIESTSPRDVPGFDFLSATSKRKTTISNLKPRPTDRPLSPTFGSIRHRRLSAQCWTPTVSRPRTPSFASAGAICGGSSRH
jgi:Carboxypeptidase regulatory-like domain